MICEETALRGVFVLTPRVFGDSRGWFYESYSKRTLEPFGITSEFVQDNHSKSMRIHTLRGLHFQRNPDAQAKLVRCTAGRIVDVAVDLRKGSPDYLKWVKVELSAENKRQIFIPRGFAHGFLTLEEGCEVMYKTDAFYAPRSDAGIRWNDPDIGVDWGVSDPVLSEKDVKSPFLRDFDPGF